MGRLARWVAAALVASSAIMLGGCVAETADEDEAVAQAAASVTLEPTPKVLSDKHQVDNGAPPPLDPVLANGNPPADPQPQPWVPPPDSPQGTGSGTSNRAQVR